jgi:hypothetical protein
MSVTRLWILALGITVAASSPSVALAKKNKAGGGGSHGAAPNARAVGELMGKFKWGMTPDDVVKVIGDQMHLKTVEDLKKETDVYKQDQLRAKEKEDIEKVRTSLAKFDGQKSGWDSSIIDKEFGHRNSESMLVMWEKDQRRFLFFSDNKLYKQYIAFNSEHPVFQGKSFDDFAKLIQGRYGAAEMKMAAMRTKEDVQLDHLEWPSANDTTLWAIDQSGFYGNYCLKLFQTSVNNQVEKSRAEHSPKAGRGNAMIDAITAPETVKGDPNEDVIDRVVGTKKH